MFQPGRGPVSVYLWLSVVPSSAVPAGVVVVVVVVGLQYM